MTRSSTNELFTPFKDPKQEFRSSRKHFKTLSLDELRSPDFNLFSDQENSEEEVAETMAETMEQYMSKTQADYGSGVARPKIEDKDNFELKGQFLKELRTNTFSGSDHEDANEHIEKVLEIVDLFHIPNITIDQVMLRAFPMSLTGAASRWLRNEPTAIQAQLNNLGREIKKVNEKVYAAQVGCEQCKGPHYTKDCPLKEEGKTLEEAYYTQFGGPFQGGGYRAAAPGFYQRNNANPSKEKDPWSFTLPCFINNVYFDNTLVDLGASVNVMPLSIYLNLGLGELAHTKLTVELADRTVKYPKGIAKNVLVGIGKFVFPVDFIILDMPKDIKVPLILGRPFLSTARAKIDEVYMLSLRERMELDLEAMLMGETLVINRSLNPFFEDYIDLNDLNEPFKLRRNQDDDLMPTIEEGKVIEEFRTRNDELDTEINDYLSYCDYDKKIHIDCAHNLKFSCMIGFEFTHANFFPLLYINVMSKEFHNSIMKDKMVYKGNNVIRALMNVPIYVETFSVVTDFAVLEDMDAYRDKGMGDVIFDEPFLRETGIKARQFEGMITIYNGDNEVTYQMARSYSRFKHHTNEQCNKITPLLKVSDEDKKNGISHSYQKLKGFYKGVLNLGPDYIRDARTDGIMAHTRAH
ncbi:putative reverse transcriptase domain-containing protein [Tanacetum coccineum]